MCYDPLRFLPCSFDLFFLFVFFAGLHVAQSSHIISLHVAQLSCAVRYTPLSCSLVPLFSQSMSSILCAPNHTRETTSFRAAASSFRRDSLTFGGTHLLPQRLIFVASHLLRSYLLPQRLIFVESHQILARTPLTSQILARTPRLRSLAAIPQRIHRISSELRS